MWYSNTPQHRNLEVVLLHCFNQNNEESHLVSPKPTNPYYCDKNPAFERDDVINIARTSACKDRRWHSRLLGHLSASRSKATNLSSIILSVGGRGDGLRRQSCTRHSNGTILYDVTAVTELSQQTYNGLVETFWIKHQRHVLRMPIKSSILSACQY